MYKKKTCRSRLELGMYLKGDSFKNNKFTKYTPFLIKERLHITMKLHCERFPISYLFNSLKKFFKYVFTNLLKDLILIQQLF